MPNPANQWIKQAMRRLRGKFGGKCQKCGSKRNLQFAHKRHTPILDAQTETRGRKERYYDIIKHPKSYILLCRRCHFKIFKRQHARRRKQ